MFSYAFATCITLFGHFMSFRIHIKSSDTRCDFHTVGSFFYGLLVADEISLDPVFICIHYTAQSLYLPINVWVHVKEGVGGGGRGG
jgi:hypothetical protein